MIEIEDAKFPQETIKAMIREETFGNLVEVEINGDELECIYLTKDSAKLLGEHLILLAGLL